jgi:hypothetical protein
MNNYISIEEVAERLKNDFDWSHSFIRECYFASKHCMVEFVDRASNRVVGDTDGPQFARIVIASAGNPMVFGIEFLFCNIRVFSVQSFTNLSFRYTYDRSTGHQISFSDPHEERECWIVADSVRVRFMGRAFLGPGFVLGFEIPNDDVNDSIRIEGDWRQCLNCNNIWKVESGIDTIRCPDCGVITKLRIDE